MDNIDAYLDGELLYGDDFGENEIAEWYADETDGYADLGARDAAAYKYGYHALNIYHAYRHLGKRVFPNVMGFGAAYGDELLPIIRRAGKITIVDPSDVFVNDKIHGVPAEYVKPVADGTLSISDETFDLVTCFGVLHHIPNVSVVVGELSRTLRPGGHMLLREPIVSMGDWRRPRQGLTRRERGIPIRVLSAIIKRSGLVITRQSLCEFPLVRRMSRMFPSGVYNSALVTRFDALLSTAFAWNINYHARGTLQKVRPTSVFFILSKPEASRRAP